MAMRCSTANGSAAICDGCADKIGFIFQAHNLLPFLTAEENVSVVLDLAGWPAERGRERGTRTA